MIKLPDYITWESREGDHRSFSDIYYPFCTFPQNLRPVKLRNKRRDYYPPHDKDASKTVGHEED